MRSVIKRSLLFSLDFANTGKLDFLENLSNNYFRDWKLCSNIEVLKKDGKWYLKEANRYLRRRDLWRGYKGDNREEDRTQKARFKELEEGKALFEDRDKQDIQKSNRWQFFTCKNVLLRFTRELIVPLPAKSYP